MIDKGIEFLPQTQIFWFQYLWNQMGQASDISNIDYVIYTTLGYKDIENRK